MLKTLKWKSGYGLAIAAGALALPLLLTCQDSASKQEGSKHTITLPQYNPDIPNGPHVEVYRNNCLICHSARYVLTQPRFPEATWQKEVKKMVDAYGASISETDQRLIVEYLVSIRGEQPATITPTK